MFKFRDVITVESILPLMALFMLSTATSAQIDNCCFVDRQCTNNAEWVNGYYAFQNNQCAATSQQQSTSSQSQPQPAPAASDDIDNCCFVDRQCDTDEEWTSGYWAFQNNQCEAPAGSPTRAAASREVNNCCFIGWQCDADDEWRGGYYAFQQDQCGVSQSHWQAQWRQRQNYSRQQSSSYSSYKDVKVDGVIFRRPTNSELCEAIERLELPLPPECEDN